MRYHAREMKTILITGSTDGLGLATAKMLAKHGVRVLLHGRNGDKVKQARASILEATGIDCPDGYAADLSQLKAVVALAEQVKHEHPRLDVLINNAGVYQLAQPLTESGVDARLIVNMVAPYLLTRELMPCFGAASRVVNVTSAAQSPVELEALRGRQALAADVAYAESKLGLLMWTRALAAKTHSGLVLVAVNPKSFLGTSMVREAYGIEGSDVSVGVNILLRAALAPEFMEANGLYYDNDSKRFASPHPDALNASRCDALLAAMNQLITNQLGEDGIHR